jgi:hypothetical protein
MDPSLQELLIIKDDPDEELEVIMRLVNPDVAPPGVRLITQFGDVITCRIKRRHIEEVYQSPLKLSIKAAKYFGANKSATLPKAPARQTKKKVAKASPPTANDATSRTVVVGIIDWGCDFTHPNFKNADGSTRLLALWDQSLVSIHPPPAPYGYGTVFQKEDINKALTTDAPFASLGYHPAKSDPNGLGAHGTHVMDIAAGNGSVGNRSLAPDALLVFVHLGANDTKEDANLGDSVRILEAIDFVRQQAGEHPLVINMSVGRHGGPHDGLTLVERAIDQFLESRTNTMLCQSTGNYYLSRTHAAGRVQPGKVTRLAIEVDGADTTPNEIEVWYSGRDVFQMVLKCKELRISVPLAQKKELVLNGEVVGRAYHRKADPNNGKNHINIFLYTTAPAGKWELELTGQVVVDGRFNAWIERDSGCKKCQARFADGMFSHEYTTGTICNGFHTLVVGAYDAENPFFVFGSFSSMGPTVDGRCKPDLLAPGVKIVAAKSAAKGETSSNGDLTIMSGTSMAAPHVTSAVAQILKVLPPGTPFHIIRQIINGSTDRVKLEAEEARIGNGLLNAERALQKALLFSRTYAEELVQKQVKQKAVH